MKFYNIIFLLLAITSCSGKRTSLKVVEINAFPIEDSISIVPLNLKDKIVSTGRIFCLGDLLALRTSDYNEGLITIIPVNDTIVKEVVQKGRGPNELLSVWYLTSLDSNKNFWAFDIVALEVMKINVPNLLSKEELSVNKVSLIDELKSTMSIDLLNDSEFICAGRFSDFRVAKIDTSGNIISKIGVNPDITGKEEFNECLSEAYQGAIKGRPDGKKFVIACRHSDQIEIFDSNKPEQELVVRGPVFAQPVFKTISKSDGFKSMVIVSKESILGYCDFTVTNDYIIGLFSGKTYDVSNEGNIIHVFDWSGKAIARMFIDKDCMSISVDPETNRVYLLGADPEPEVYYFDLNI